MKIMKIRNLNNNTQIQKNKDEELTDILSKYLDHSIMTIDKMSQRYRNSR